MKYIATYERNYFKYAKRAHVLRAAMKREGKVGGSYAKRNGGTK